MADQAFLSHRGHQLAGAVIHTATGEPTGIAGPGTVHGVQQPVVGAQIGTQWGARLRAEQLRILLALLVLAVCGKLALDLFLRPDELYSITPGILK